MYSHHSSIVLKNAGMLYVALPLCIPSVMTDTFSTDCDSTIQFPSQSTPLLDCNFACAGNATETCGGGGRINLFLNTAVPPPTLVQSVNATDVGGEVVGVWNYAGCYTYVSFSLCQRLKADEGTETK